LRLIVSPLSGTAWVSDTHGSGYYRPVIVQGITLPLAAYWRVPRLSFRLASVSLRVRLLWLQYVPVAGTKQAKNKKMISA
jgi:hypothetical protein